MFWRLWHLLWQGFPRRPTWTADDIPDQTNRVHVVTGGAAGIGRETVKALLKKDATVYIAARNPAKAQEAVAQLKEETGREARFLELDLASLDSIQRAAQTFMAQEKELHVLYNNAGVMFTDMKLLTADGYDLQFGTNVLGHFYFTQLLLPVLKAGKGRVVSVSSIATLLFPIPALDLDALRQGPKLRKDVWWFGSPVAMYSFSKLGNILHAKELHRRYAQDGIVSIATNPGNINTELYQNTVSVIRWVFKLVFLYPVPFGALTQLYAGTAPEAAALGGQVLVPWARVGVASPRGNDPVLARKLWDWMEVQVERHEARDA